MGHRRYVGGADPETWYGIGRLQFHFLVANGLAPHHVFLDVACGSLRLGQFLIPYLGAGCYHGLDIEPSLVDHGLNKEILFDIDKIKKPKFYFSDKFDVSYAPSFDFAMAQSLFTHLTPEDIQLCFSSLAAIASEKSKFFFTYFEGSEESNPSEASHAQKVWRYPFDRITEIAMAGGWTAARIGDWGHPRGQMVAVARIAEPDRSRP